MPTPRPSRPLIAADDCPFLEASPATAATPARIAGLCIDTTRPVRRRPGPIVSTVGGWMIAALDAVATAAAAVRDEIRAELSTAAR